MNKILKHINKIIEILLIILIVTMTVTCIFQVIARYFLGKTYAGSEELMRYSIIWATILGASYVYGERGHLAITFIVDKLPHSVKRMIELIIEILILAFSIIFLVFGGAKLTGQTWGQITAGLHISKGLVYLVLPISGIIFTMYSILQIIDILKGKEIEFAESELSLKDEGVIK